MACYKKIGWQTGRLIFRDPGQNSAARVPCSHVRYPDTGGLNRMFPGQQLSKGTPVVFLDFFSFLPSCRMKIRQEEKLMRPFPREYPGYRTRVKALLPCLL
jgi:protein-S-isoprenylcysteine O-methyltransferase Ste14